MEKPVKEIKENYSKYKKLVDEPKLSSVSPIPLDKIKDNRKDIRIKVVNVRHQTLSDKIELTVESKIQNNKDFKFNLRAPGYTEKPFFRFDSDGVAHYNKDIEVELPKQKVETPHFHKFDSHGNNIAYKTESLKDENECKALIEDINLCMAHYCDESKTFYNKEAYIEVIQTPENQIDFNENRDNPLEGVDYE